MRPHGNYTRVNPQDPSAFGQCDRCGRWFNHEKLVWQLAWSGTQIYNIQVLVCTEGGCYDTPNEQLRTIILPPDPPPVLNARVPNFAYEEQTIRITEYNSPKNPPWGAGPQMARCLQNGTVSRILEFNTSS